MDMKPLGPGAQIALWTLSDHPTINNSADICFGPYGIEQVDLEAIELGLRQLESLDLVQRRPNGGWILSPQMPSEIAQSKTPSGSRND